MVFAAGDVAVTLAPKAALMAVDAAARPPLKSIPTTVSLGLAEALLGKGKTEASSTLINVTV